MSSSPASPQIRQRTLSSPSLGSSESPITPTLRRTSITSLDHNPAIHGVSDNDDYHKLMAEYQARSKHLRDQVENLEILSNRLEETKLQMDQPIFANVRQHHTPPALDAHATTYIGAPHLLTNTPDLSQHTCEASWHTQNPVAHPTCHLAPYNPHWKRNLHPSLPRAPIPHAPVPPIHLYPSLNTRAQSFFPYGQNYMGMQPVAPARQMGPYHTAAAYQSIVPKEAMIVVDLSSIKFDLSYIRWGLQGGARFWISLTQWISEIEAQYVGRDSVPVRYCLKLCGGEDYKFYDLYDFKFGLVREFLNGLIGAANGTGRLDRVCLPSLDSISKCLVEMDRPIHRIYLAKFSSSPLPILCSHIDTVLLAGRDDRGYTQDNIANTRGLAVIGADKWFTTISSGKSTITAGTLEQSVGVPLPIEIIRTWHDISLLRYEGPATPCTSYYLRGQCVRRSTGVCRYLHGEIQMSDEFRDKYRDYIGSQPCKSGSKCRNRQCLYYHESREMIGSHKGQATDTCIPSSASCASDESSSESSWSSLPPVLVEFRSSNPSDKQNNKDIVKVED